MPTLSRRHLVTTRSRVTEHSAARQLLVTCLRRNGTRPLHKIVGRRPLYNAPEAASVGGLFHSLPLALIQLASACSAGSSRYRTLLAALRIPTEWLAPARPRPRPNACRWQGDRRAAPGPLPRARRLSARRRAWHPPVAWRYSQQPVAPYHA
jgi:hypothetical protein